MFGGQVGEGGAHDATLFGQAELLYDPLGVVGLLLDRLWDRRLGAPVVTFGRLAELAGLGRRRALDAARLAALYEDASSLLDRLLLRLIATRQAAG